MSNPTDARYAKCDVRIQEALLALLDKKQLSQISVSELARKANISRGTFYAHYGNVEEVYERLVTSVLSDVQSFQERFPCAGSGCSKGGKYTYCEKIRAQNHWKGVTSDPMFFHTLMLIETYEEAQLDPLIFGLSKSESDAIRLFQMSGCHAVATSKFAETANWPNIRALIDAFIEGGLAAIKERGTNPLQ